MSPVSSVSEKKPNNFPGGEGKIAGNAVYAAFQKSI